MKTAIITGGSSGIGKETARYLSENGYVVYELSRRDTQFDKVNHITCDVTSEIDCKNAVEKVISESNRIDLLINNAGFGISGALEFTEVESMKRIFDVNLFGAVNMIQCALPELRKTKGRIINVSSVGGVLALPFQSFYSASKYALNGLTLALANEVKRHGVSVCALMPGDVSTGFTSAREKSETGSDVYGNSISRSVSTMEKDEQNGIKPIKIAKKIHKIAKKRRVKPLYVAGFKYKLFVVLAKVLPTRLVNYIVGKIYAK